MRTARIFQNSLIMAILFASGPSHASDQLLRVPAVGDPALIIPLPDGWTVFETKPDSSTIVSEDRCCLTTVWITQGVADPRPIVAYETEVLKTLGATKISLSASTEIAGISANEQAAVVDRNGTREFYRLVAFWVDETHFVSILHDRRENPQKNDEVFQDELSVAIDHGIKIENASSPTPIPTSKHPVTGQAAQSTSSFGWQYTRWGMTPDEVVRASQGLACAGPVKRDSGLDRARPLN